MNKPKNFCYACDTPIYGNVSKKRRVLCQHCTDKLVAKVRALEAITKKPIKNKADYEYAMILFEQGQSNPKTAILSRPGARRMAATGKVVSGSPIGLAKQPVLNNEGQVNAITKRRPFRESQPSKGDGQGTTRGTSPALTLDGRGD